MNRAEDVGRILKVSGPLVVAEGMGTSRMYDVVKVSEKRLVGEIIGLEGKRASIQVYEDTGGIGPGEPVYPTHDPLSRPSTTVFRDRFQISLPGQDHSSHAALRFLHFPARGGGTSCRR